MNGEGGVSEWIATGIIMTESSNWSNEHAEESPGFRWPLSLRVGSIFAGIGVGYVGRLQSWGRNMEPVVR